MGKINYYTWQLASIAAATGMIVLVVYATIGVIHLISHLIAHIDNSPYGVFGVIGG